MRRLPAAGSMLLTLALVFAPGLPARADLRFLSDVVHVPSPMAGVANAVKTALEQSGCNVSDANVQHVQGSDGFAVALDGAVREVDLAPEGTVGTPPILPDLDIYFYDNTCTLVGFLATAAVHERCGFTVGLKECPPGASFAVVTMTAGANAVFDLTWSF